MKNTGFTMIELLIAIAIIGALAALAIPFYDAYAVRSKTAEAFSMVSSYQPGVAECVQTNGSSVLGCNTSSPGIPGLESGTYGGVVNINDGVITFQFSASAGSALSGGTIQFRPTVDTTGSVYWSCVVDGAIVTVKQTPPAAGCTSN